MFAMRVNVRQGIGVSVWFLNRVPSHLAKLALAGFLPETPLCTRRAALVAKSISDVVSFLACREVAYSPSLGAVKVRAMIPRVPTSAYVGFGAVL